MRFKHKKTGALLEIKRKGHAVSTLYLLDSKGNRVLNKLINNPTPQTRIVLNSNLVKIT